MFVVIVEFEEFEFGDETVSEMFVSGLMIGVAPLVQLVVVDGNTEDQRMTFESSSIDDEGYWPCGPVGHLWAVPSA